MDCTFIMFLCFMVINISISSAVTQTRVAWKTEITLTVDCLPYAKHWTIHSTYTISLNPCHTPYVRCDHHQVTSEDWQLKFEAPGGKVMPGLDLV